MSGGSLRHSPDVIDVPSPLPQSRAARARVRVSQRSRLATARRAGTASLYINRGRYVHAILCPRPCVAAELRAGVRGSAACPRVEAALRLIDPRKLYSILRPGSINRLIDQSLTTLNDCML